MERLTFEGNFCDIAQCKEIPCPYNDACSARKVWDRLKAYEDMVETSALTVSASWRGRQDSFTVTDISTLNGRTMLNTSRCGVIDARDVGKTVFLTREEAKKALEVKDG